VVACSQPRCDDDLLAVELGSITATTPIRPESASRSKESTSKLLAHINSAKSRRASEIHSELQKSIEGGGILKLARSLKEQTSSALLTSEDQAALQEHDPQIFNFDDAFVSQRACLGRFVPWSSKNSSVSSEFLVSVESGWLLTEASSLSRRLSRSEAEWLLTTSLRGQDEELSLRAFEVLFTLIRLNSSSLVCLSFITLLNPREICFRHRLPSVRHSRPSDSPLRMLFHSKIPPALQILR
jgi:hypothetical protein